MLRVGARPCMDSPTWRVGRQGIQPVEVNAMRLLTLMRHAAAAIGPGDAGHHAARHDGRCHEQG